MEFVFIRHGQPAWSVDGLSQVDPALTPLGRLQAERVAARLAADEHEFAEIIVSPALRAQQTAQPLVRLTGLAPLTIEGMTEIQMPDWTGTPEQEVQRIFDESRSRPPEEWWKGLGGGESFRDFHNRITGAMADLLGRRSVRPDPSGHPHLWRVENDPQRIAVVAHGGTNAVALGFLLGLDPTPWEWERFVLGHASIASVRSVSLAGGHVFSLRAFNDQEHLPGDLRSR